MEIKEILRLNLYCYVALLTLIMIGISAVLIIRKAKFLDDPFNVEFRYTNPVDNEDNILLKKNLITILIRTTTLYIFMILTLYYLIVMEEVQLLSRNAAVFSRILVFITVFGYLVYEFLAPTNNIYVVATRLGVVAFIISFSQMIQLVYCIYNEFIFNNLMQILKKIFHITKAAFTERSED